MDIDLKSMDKDEQESTVIGLLAKILSRLEKLEANQKVMIRALEQGDINGYRDLLDAFGHRTPGDSALPENGTNRTSNRRI